MSTVSELANEEFDKRIKKIKAASAFLSRLKSELGKGFSVIAPSGLPFSAEIHLQEPGQEGMDFLIESPRVRLTLTFEGQLAVDFKPGRVRPKRGHEEEQWNFGENIEANFEALKSVLEAGFRF